MDDKSILNKKNAKSDVSGEPISAKDDDVVISAIMKHAEKSAKKFVLLKILHIQKEIEKLIRY